MKKVTEVLEDAVEKERKKTEQKIEENTTKEG
jgi:hypothetical protein